MRIGSIRGTQIHVEPSFLIVVALFVILNMESAGGQFRHALLWAPLLFFSVLIHEIGHAATLGALGFGPSYIALAGFGGVTINQRRAEPWQDILVSIAGPICSFVLAAIAFVLLVFIPYFQGDPFFAAFLPLVIVANVFWGIFNLLPIHPLDGGNALRSLLRHFLSPRTAEVGSSWISILFSVGILGLALFAGQWFIAIFAAMFAHQNFQRLQMINKLQDPETRSDDEKRDQNE